MSAEASSLSLPAAGPLASPLREDIIESAVRFLADPKVQSSTLAKKISFLETKGLTNAEIEDALARAKNHTQTPGAAAPAGTGSGSGNGSTGYGYAQPIAPLAPPPRPHLDWKDYFIAAVVAGGLGYGLYMFAKKYITPLLLARDDNLRLEEEKKLLVEQNELTRKQLEVLGASTTQILETISKQSQRTSEAIEGMSSVMDKIATQEIEHNTSSRRLLITLEDLQREIAGLSAKTAAAGGASVADVQSDIRSLRSMLLSQRAPTHSFSPAARSLTPTTAFSSAAPAEENPVSTSNTGSAATSPMPTPTIPAWQLALMGGGSGNEKKETETH
ncbi:peroxisomal membrane protein pex14 [Kickxella alabastrina]|uniref:Peroxisomal membrane protein pex14 n=1 Tax=Kickxella alabastrina TaxID=61397 RepID=A0ACC1IJF7_9FUNG|nr:peroxisomal membrane protein pex14 [Kickxella alabastrina]